MKQEKLEEKVIDLFERQSFKVEKDRNQLKAVKDDQTLSLKAFSSEVFEAEEIKSSTEENDKVFVDEPLEKVQNLIPNDVSILREETETEEYETPSYEVIGSVAVINDLAGMNSEDAVKGILEHQSNVETIILKEEGLNGEFRVGEYRKLYGDKTETIHKEYGCRYRVDPTKTYFSERFATERNRVVSQIEKGEKVLVMFAGIGPFGIMAARNREPEKVVMVEKNPEAFKYLEENIRLNNVERTVDGYEGDVVEIIPDLGEFDRIVMPLPGSADEFLDLAFQHTEKDSLIHYYRFVEENNWDQIIDEIDSVAEKAGKDYRIKEKVVCGERAAHIDRVCIDIEIK